MATSKSGGTKPKKVMDVGKPSETKASPTSKPVITGHKPLIGDPMVREDVPVSQLSPTDSEDKPKDSDSNSEEITTEQPEEVTEEPVTEPVAEELPEEPLMEAAVAEAEAKPKAKSANSRFKPSEELVEQTAKEKNKGKTETEESGSGGSLTIDKTDEDGPKGEGVGAISEVLGDAKGVKEAEIAEMERQEQAKQMMSSGKYRVKLGAAAHHHGGMQSSMVFALIMLLVVAVLGYLAIDSGFYKSNIKLPFHVFKQVADTTDATAAATATNKPTTSTSGSSSSNTTVPVTIPANFKAYKMVDSGTDFAYPSAWGNVLVTPEKGYTKRDASLSSDGVYAYIASFSKNQDVTLAVTSDKYLPVARDKLYYDYLKWCQTGSNYYNSVLNFKTSGSTDTADKVTCDQGPLTGVTALDAKTIQQLAVKDAKTGTVIGDVYSQNLTATSGIVVLHVLDAQSKNADDIKKLLATVVSASN